MTKDELRQYRSMKLEICQLQRRIMELEQLGHGYDRELIQPLQDLYQTKLQELIIGQLKIEKAIESLDTVERELMRARYIDGKRVGGHSRRTSHTSGLRHTASTPEHSPK